MDRTIREQFNEDILARLVERYRISVDALEALDGFESFVYEVKGSQQPYILRVSHSSHRTPNQIRGEVEWINYLAERDVPAARAVPSPSCNLVEVVDASEGQFAATAFVRAPGTYVRREAWQPDLFRRLGQIVGRMHALAKGYVLGDPRVKRPEWYEDAEGFVEARLPHSEQTVIDKAQALVSYLHTLPVSREAYGLVHIDVHRGNFYVNEDGQITLFDFDDCQYSWFADDLAMVIFYAVPHNCVGKENLDLARSFFLCFLEGYRRENVLDPSWFRQIPAFLKQRELDLYAAIYAGFDDLDDLPPWPVSFMEGRRGKIASDVPYVDLDFEVLVRRGG